MYLMTDASIRAMYPNYDLEECIWWREFDCVGMFQLIMPDAPLVVPVC